MIKVAVIIPCFNEEKNIRDVIQSVKNVNSDADFKLFPVVINDHSTDLTSSFAKNENCILLNLSVNLGIGGAVQTGYKYALENYFDIAIQLDGDGQHPASEIYKIINPILNDNADVVIGSRFLTGEGYQSTLMRRIGIIFFMRVIKFFTQQKINDSTSGFRALNRKALEIVSFHYPDDYPEPVSIITFYKKKLVVKEVQVEMKARQGGKSSIEGFSSIYYMLKVFLAICFTYFKKEKK